jgi:enamine deaminase RidA (YjgF/YER057c/UK114 family)
MSFEARLADLGLALPDAPAPAGNYVSAVVAGGLLHTAGQIPRKDGSPAFLGTVGDDLTIEDGQEAARLCCLAGLAVAKAELGSLDRIKRVVKVNGYVRSGPGFTDQPAVINGASDLLVAVFGDAGRHARAAIGVSGLPLGVGVEIDFLFEVRVGS